MNRAIGRAGAGITGVAVLCFAACMPARFDFGSYVACMFLAFGFLMMTAGFRAECPEERRAAGDLGMAFACVYAVLVLLVYFAQVTAVRLDALGGTAMGILDYRRFGLFFDYDLLGYGMMALSTVFTGLTVGAETKGGKALKRLLLVHGVFFLSCFFVPMLGVFSTDGPDWVGIVLLEFWCVYFLPIAVLAFVHFKKHEI